MKVWTPEHHRVPGDLQKGAELSPGRETDLLAAVHQLATPKPGALDCTTLSVYSLARLPAREATDAVP